MKNSILTFFLLCAISIQATVAQVKPHLQDLKSTRTTPLTLEDMSLRYTLSNVPKAQNRGFQAISRQFQSLPNLIKPVNEQQFLKIKAAPETGLPLVIQGTVKNLPEGSIETQSFAYLNAVKEALQIENPTEEFSILKTETDNLGQTHVRLQQEFAGIPVYGSEVILHQQNGTLNLFNGRYYPTPELPSLNPGISENVAQQIAVQDLSTQEPIKELSDFEQKLLQTEQIEAALVIFHQNKDLNQEKLAWHFTLIPNLISKWSYFVDAQTGEILQRFSHVCKFHSDHTKAEGCTHHHHSKTDHSEETSTANLPPDGPATANATDLFGVSRTINTYEVSNTYFLLDGSRAMFNGAQSDLPNDPVGAIWTIDAQNTSPANNNFAAIQSTSTNNNWNNPTAISAHYNGSEAYEYFLNTFGRNSINGQGGTIISVFNTADENGGDMDNAFWTGVAIFYGNGDQAFNAPLAKSLDVAGHEMAHGVIQTTANLEYMGESGALNESFADIFGAMIDRDDWRLGEDVVNTTIFSSGALRDMQNPNNGGNSLNDPGYQPDHVDDQFTGSQDNGGVHINSGIVNRAYYLFATEIGKDEAEQIYYRALTTYLVKSSQFVDLRIAVVQAATDLHGANSVEVNAAKDALSAVGIGEGSGTNTQTDEQLNPGDDFVLMTDDANSQLYIFAPDGTVISNPLTTISPLSKPSITDDGSTVVYVDTDKNIQQITIDWNNSSVNQEVLSESPVWRNAAISKDGTKLAALTDDLDNKLLIFDLQTSTSPQEFTLVNPTTGPGEPAADNVEFADIIEWDFTGEWVMYDAFNSLTNASGENIEYWDISFIKVFENGNNNFDDGFVSKLFSGLPENTSVGNPTFSKNSDYIIALDFIDEFNGEYAILGVNTETGETGTILNHSQLGYPNYSMTDEQIVFDDVSGFFEDPLLSFTDVQEDKITGTGEIEGFIDGGKWGIWFANGERDLVNTQEPLWEEKALNVFPNPFANELKVEVKNTPTGDVKWEVFDVAGKLVFSKNTDSTTGLISESLDLRRLGEGAYFLKVTTQENTISTKIYKRR